MKNVIVLLFCAFCFQLNAQTKDVQTLMNQLDDFMDNHIPEMHSSVVGYQITYENGILEKTTLVEDGENHSKTFEMQDAVITSVKQKLDREEAKMYGYKVYYEIKINGEWIIDGLQSKKDSDYVVNLLEDMVAAIR